MDDQLQFERQKWADEIELRNREIALKENESKPSPFKNPLFLTAMSAIVAGSIGVITNFVDSRNKIELEERKSDLTLLTSLIQSKDQSIIRRNLSFLVEAKIIRNKELRSDLSSYLENVKTEDLPAITNLLVTPQNVSEFDICSQLSGKRTSIKYIPMVTSDLEKIGKEFDVEIPALQAFMEVETKPDRLDRGLPKILFERHYFHRLTNGAYDQEYPDISNAKWGGYKGGLGEYDRLEAASKLDCKAALSSTSWGSAQIMGANFQDAGFDSVEAFTKAMLTSEPDSLRALLKFMKNNNLLDKLRRREWQALARGYNGPSYRDNGYEVKLREAYERFAAVN
jgi:hypothetical protein